MRLRVSSVAQADITAIALTLRMDSRRAAERFIDRVDAAFDQLKRFPVSGANRPDIRPGLRALPLPPFAHLLFYATSSSEIEIVRVIAGRRNLKAILDE